MAEEESGKLAHAHLILSAPSTDGKKAGSSERIDFTFNPKELTLARSAEWKAKPSKKPAMPEFVGSKPASMSIEMFLDASASGDVTTTVNKLMSCVHPHATTEKDKPSPPFVAFGWGKVTYLDNAYIKTVSVKYTRFRSNGTPIRAIATVAIEELRPVPPKQNPTSGALEIQGEHVISGGDTLASLAYAHLGSPTLWRRIAEANNIDDPFRLVIGQRLVVPSAEPPSEARN